MPADPWLGSILDRAGAAKAFVTPRGLSLERRLNSATTASFTVDFTDAEPPDLEVGSRSVALYRGSTLVFAGPIIGLTWQGSTQGGRSANVVAVDPFGVLNRRYLVPPYLDNFTDTNGTDLDGHTADTGETYTLRSGDTGDIKVHSNRLYPDTSDPEIYYSTGVATSLPFAMEFTVYNAGNCASDGAWIGVGWNFDDAMDDGYVCWVQVPTASDEGGEIWVQEETADSRSTHLVSDPMDDDWQGETILVRVEQDVGGAARVYRNGALVGTFSDTTRTTGQMVIGALDGGGLMSTTTGLHMDSVQHEPRRIFTADEATDIVQSLVDTANAQGETALDTGTFPTTVDRDRTYDIGKNIGEAITQLAEVEDGFWFRVDANLSGAKLGDLEIEYSASGTDQDDVRFEYGAGTLDNLEAYSVEREPPVNDALAVGQGSVANGQLTARAASATSKATYGLWGKVVSYSDVSEETTLADHADDALYTTPATVYKVSPREGSNAEASPPRLYADFDVGDLCRLTIKDGGVDVEEITVRVLAVKLEVLDDGEVERIADLQLEAV